MVDLLEVEFVAEEIPHSFSIPLGIVERLQVVVMIDANGNSPVLSHLTLTTVAAELIV